MDSIKEREKKRIIRVAITEGLMAVTIILLTIILLFVVQGYGINPSEGRIERLGLVEFSSEPGGAVVSIDGNEIFFRTSTNRTLSAGKHEIVLSRAGYSSWAGEINVVEGMMYRTGARRLYKLEREVETVASSVEASSAYVSPDRKIMLYWTEEGKCYILRTNEGDVTELPIEKPFEVVEISGDHNKMLAKNADGDYVIIRIDKTAETINVTKNLGMNFDEVRSENASMERLLGLSNHQIFEINVVSAEATATTATDVASFVNYGSRIAYVSLPHSEMTSDGDNIVADRSVRELRTTEVGTLTSVALYQSADLFSPRLIKINEYYGDYYIALAEGEEVKVFSGRWPDGKNTMKIVAEKTLGWTPAVVDNGGNGKTVVFQNGNSAAFFDAEEFRISDYDIATMLSSEIGSAKIVSRGSLDGYSQYVVTEDGKLVAYDAEARNTFTLALNVKNLPITFSENGDFVYYFTEDRIERQRIK